MAANFYMMEAANLFCGDHDPEASKHLTLSEMKLPALAEKYQDHHPGGAPVGIEVNVGVEKLGVTFKLAGHDPDLLGLFGLGRRGNNVFTAYGLIRDKRTDRAIESKTVIQGRLGKIEPDAFKQGDLQGHDYSINGIVHYELFWDGREKVYWDFFENVWRVDGRVENIDALRILRIGV